ncbi:hypothetical protein TRAPUB_10674 [Trametes pubescens]|uniref:Uncharacterized protein n=1 Tax=Trametes pubescens TaxID=154538 RepID=A0A1M2VYZ4_TRAPU|nr:hypothetical protein TRAPUB_10674 [Trametes pubescens]
MSPIHSLPVELLTTIFQLGVDSDPIPDDQTRGEHTFEVLVSHVCRHWRHVALHTPHLWTTVHFRTLAHMARGEVYLARNAHLPIDIYVDTCSEDDYHLRKDLLFRDQFLAVFNVVLPHIHRWRELHLIVADLECKSFARQVLSKCGTAPALRTLQLWHVMNWQTSERLFNHIGPPPVVVFGGALPSLKHIILQGVNLPWSRSPFLCNLTSVEFALHSDNVRMPFALWRDMLRASPALTRLSLLFAGPRASSSGTSPVPDGIEWWGAAPPPPDAVLPPGAPLPPSTDPVQLLQLREVQLNNLEADYLIALFRTLHAPAVRSLHLGLDFDDQDFTPFIEYLAAPPGPHKLANGAGAGAARPQPKFPVLESLSVSALKCTVPSWRALLAVSPKLTRLEADFTQLSEHAFDVLLETVPEPQDADARPPSPSESDGKGKARADATEAKTVPILPKLESVRVSGVEGKQLSELATFRRMHGCRIRRWEIEEGARDEHSEALEQDAEAASTELLKRRDAEDREAGRACEPWRWDEPLEKVVWFREEEEDGEESEFDDGEEGYAEEEDADGEGEGEGGGE